MKITPEDRRIAEVRRAFMARLQNTPEKHRRAVVDMAAVKPVGFGEGHLDPYTRALAVKMSEAFKLQDEIEAAKRELAGIEAQKLPESVPYSRTFPEHRARVLARKEDLTTAIERGLAKYVALQEDPLDSAKAKAVEHFNAADAAREKTRKLSEAITRAEAEAEQARIDDMAASIVRARRGGVGKPAGSSQ